MADARRTILALAAATSASLGTAAASTIFSSDFEAEASHSATNFTAFDDFTASEGSVDLIRSGGWRIACAGGSTGCVDLDGTTRSDPASRFVGREIKFAPGAYRLNFDLSGNQRDARTDQVSVSVGSLLADRRIELAGDAPFRNFAYDFDVSTLTVASVTFLADGASDYVGLILDNVRVDVLPVSSMPLPGAAWLLVAGVAGLACARRKRRQDV